MDATSKTRFHYSRRMKLHAKWSTWVVVGISLALILTSLLQAYELGSNIGSKYFSLFQVFSSIAVLVYSLMISKNDYSSQAEKMYSCASQIGSLKSEAYPYLVGDDQAKYVEIDGKYQQILKLFEANSMNDFRADYWRAQLEMEEEYPFTCVERAWLNFKWWSSYAADFFVYPLFAVVYLCLIWWIWLGDKTAV